MSLVAAAVLGVALLGTAATSGPPVSEATMKCIGGISVTAIGGASGLSGVLSRATEDPLVLALGIAFGGSLGAVQGGFLACDGEEPIAGRPVPVDAGYRGNPDQEGKERRVR